MNPLNRRIVASTILWAAGLFVALTTSMTSGELTAGEKLHAPATSADFAYFPGQYINKATEPSEHIQAF